MEPALLTLERGRGTGVTGGESSSTLSCVGEEDVEEFSAGLREEEEGGPSSTVRTRWANFREHTDSLRLLSSGDTCTIISVLLSPLSESCSR